MKYIRFKFNDIVYSGILDGDKAIEICNFSFEESDFIFGLEVPFSKIQILQPVLPSKVIGLAYNYKDLVGKQESYEEPLIFIKPSTSVIGPGETIYIHKDKKTWAEVEIAIIIKKTCKNTSVEKAKDYIFGYTIGNDVTMENVYGRDHHLARSKSLDSFCPLGSFVNSNIIADNIKLENRINGQIFQSGYSSNRIVNDYEAVSLISSLITLYAGDVILTGTPANAMNSIITDGDIVSLKVDSLGELNNPVKYIS
jgi:2-keto-4-pentenoate hydratase/2-oxohepta-3-ene-1,7-dioic acid hydratase in catechol pathway